MTDIVDELLAVRSRSKRDLLCRAARVIRELRSELAHERSLREFAVKENRRILAVVNQLNVENTELKARLNQAQAGL